MSRPAWMTPCQYNPPSPPPSAKPSQNAARTISKSDIEELLRRDSSREIPSVPDEYPINYRRGPHGDVVDLSPSTDADPMDYSRGPRDGNEFGLDDD